MAAIVSESYAHSGTLAISVSWEISHRRIRSRSSEAKGRDSGSSEHITSNNSISDGESELRCWWNGCVSRQTESNNSGYTPKIDLNILPSCQMSARNGQYGLSDSISGATSLPYWPRRNPVVGSPVTTLDDGSESGSNAMANSKSFMKYRMGKKLRNGAHAVVDQFVPSGWLNPPAKLMRMLSLSMSYSKIKFWNTR